MCRRDKLHRRTIRSALKADHGWDVQSHVDGTISVWSPSARLSAAEFREQVIAAVRALDYEPTVIATADE